ncbi:MAG: pyrimidine reductase [Ruminococcaceae bacterium]|nr:pyrimidine reductase [Oscillospiraceae bacterium]MBE6965624.1 pyrimidine reductase [Oscillospiraceae bacterium]
MPKPYIICHMVTSIDGKVTGEFLSRAECEAATDVYYELNSEYNRNGANGFICGRVTMESSFTGGWYPDLTEYPLIESKDDFIPDNLSGFYAVSFDPKGKLGWKSNKIIDEDPGYNNAQIIEVLTEQADGRYLGYLQAMEIPYIFAGETEIDVHIATAKLYSLTDISSLLLEGGSIVNGYFERAGVIDELSLVVAPIVADAEDKPLFMASSVSDFELKEIKQYNSSVIWLNYKRK